MDNEKEILEKSMMLKLVKRSSILISFVGVSYIILGILNIFFDIPVEYIISISFAAFFFVVADFVIVSNPITNSKINFYTFFLLCGVLSFIIMPVLLSLFFNSGQFLIKSSESLSVISLGLVLVMINLKMWNFENKVVNSIIQSIEHTEKSLKKYSTYIDTSQNQIKELREENNKLKEENKKLKS